MKRPLFRVQGIQESSNFGATKHRVRLRDVLLKKGGGFQIYVCTYYTFVHMSSNQLNSLDTK